MNKIVLIRADSSSTIGTGHIMRDLVLAEQLQNTDIIFATQNLKGNINHKIEEKNYKIKILDSNNIEEVIRLIEKYSVDLVIIDNYKIDYNYEKELKEKTGVELFVLDDTYEKHFCDILLNHNPGADEKKYSDIVPENSVKLCGTRFTLIRDEFKDLVKKRVQKVSSEKKVGILVMMGGSDPLNVTYKIAKELSKNSSYQLSLVTTTSNLHLSMLLQLAKIHKNVVLHVNSTTISKLMRRANLAIISPSVSAAEAMYMKLPFIAIQTADNQSAIFKYLKDNRLPVIKHYNANKLSLELVKTIRNHEHLLRRLHTFHFSSVNLETYL